MYTHTYTHIHIFIHKKLKKDKNSLKVVIGVSFINP